MTKQLHTYEIKLAAPESEFSKTFVQGMANRLSVSYHKYGAVADAMHVDEIEGLKIRLALYEDTGNTEWLIDVANFAMIEFMFPRHPNAHFRATDSHESPGLPTVDGDDQHGHHSER